jgi:hypothetical protein
MLSLRQIDEMWPRGGATASVLAGSAEHDLVQEAIATSVALLLDSESYFHQVDLLTCLLGLAQNESGSTANRIAYTGDWTDGFGVFQWDQRRGQAEANDNAAYMLAGTQTVGQVMLPCMKYAELWLSAPEAYDIHGSDGPTGDTGGRSHVVQLWHGGPAFVSASQGGRQLSLWHERAKNPSDERHEQAVEYLSRLNVRNDKANERVRAWEQAYKWKAEYLLGPRP